MQGFLSRDGTPPSELLDLGRAEVLHYGVELVTDRVVDPRTGFALRLLSGRVVQARHVVLATGAGDVLPTGIESAWVR
jgi:thioredoxin reductase